MKKISVLTISGSDSISGAGVQADIRTISALGGVAHTVITAVTAQNSQGISDIYELPYEMVMGQLHSILSDITPQAVKIGMLRQPSLMRSLREEIKGYGNIVCAPGILSSKNESLISDEALQEYARVIFPITDILVLKCSEAEKVLRTAVRSQEEMLSAAGSLLRMGTRAVLLRGGHCSKGLLTGLLLTSGSSSSPEFFSSPNLEDWQRHGVGGTMSAAIAARLAMGDDIRSAIKAAHDYIRCQTVYAVSSDEQSARQVELYNRFMELIASDCRTRHDTAHYASRLAVSPRYLAAVTDRVAGKSPKQLISDYLMQEIERSLLSSDRPVQEISRDFGFRTQAALAKFFSAHRGCSPTAFRNGSQDTEEPSRT